MNQNTRQRGIGLTAIIIIVAVVALLGVAAVQLSDREEATVTPEQQAEIDSARNEAARDLVALRTSLTAGAGIDVQAVLSTITSIRDNLAQAYAGASADTRAELEELEDELDELEAAVIANADPAELAEAIAELLEELDAELEAGLESETSVMDDDAVLDDEGEMDDGMEDEMTTTSGEAGANASGTIEVDMSDDMIDASVDAETSAESNVNLQ